MTNNDNAQTTVTSGANDVTEIMAALLPVHRAVTIEWLVDAAATAAERALNAPYTFLYFEEQDGRLSYKPPVSDLRRRSLQRAIDAFGPTVLRPKLDPSTLPQFAEALESGTPTALDATDLFGELPAVGDAQKTLGINKLCVAPLNTAGERLGALLLMLTDDADMERARLFADHVACAAVNLRNTEAARSQGVTDVVRSVFDERKLETDLQRELGRAARYKRQVSIAVIEATNLRLLREQFGAFLTDRLLQRLGESLAEGARDVDTLGAYKQSGYTMILAEAHTEGAAVAARRMLAKAQDARIEGQNVPGLELHLVVGWATYPADGTSTPALFTAAERRMYDPELQSEVA
jgi:diguanylate cyclase (GGDEF)-like protein